MVTELTWCGTKWQKMDVWGIYFGDIVARFTESLSKKKILSHRQKSYFTLETRETFTDSTASKKVWAGKQCRGHQHGLQVWPISTFFPFPCSKEMAWFVEDRRGRSEGVNRNYREKRCI